MLNGKTVHAYSDCGSRCHRRALARPAQAGRDVTFLVRERRQQQLQQTGLVLQTPEGARCAAAAGLAATLTGDYDRLS